eukprot:Gb_06076 [translate_table: standard]
MFLFTVAGVWGLVALKLADEEFLPFSYERYAAELQKDNSILAVAGYTRITTAPLQQSIAELRKATKRIAKQQKELKGYYGFELKDFLYRLSQKRALNDRLLMAERAFTDSDGLPGRHWYKHLIYGPSKHNDYVSTSFPAVYDSLQNAISLNTSNAWFAVQREVWRISRAITRVAQVLYGELSRGKLVLNCT